MSDIHVIVQAGGTGQRISSVAQGTPKPLLPVGGTSMVERLLQQFTDAGVRRITVVIGANGHGIRARILWQMETLPRSLQLDFFEEKLALGNTGALGEISTGDADVLLCFADLVTDLDFARFCEIHAQRGCNVTLTSHFEHHQLTLGELIVDGDTVQGYLEKPRKAFLICSGIALFDARAMRVARALPRPYGLADLVLATLAAGCSVTHWQHRAYWIDVNTPELLARAREDAEHAAQTDTIPESQVRRQAGRP